MSGPWERGLFSELTVPTLVVAPVDGEMAPDPALIGNPLVRCVEIEGAVAASGKFARRPISPPSTRFLRASDKQKRWSLTAQPALWC